MSWGDEDCLETSNGPGSKEPRRSKNRQGELQSFSHGFETVSTNLFQADDAREAIKGPR
jgi:hypothetical protein